jgi:hypothetical protein
MFDAATAGSWVVILGEFGEATAATIGSWPTPRRRFSENAVPGRGAFEY